MTDITIPPEALEEAAEELFHMQYGDSKGSWADAPEWLKITVRAEARAACLAMLRAWPGMEQRTSGHHPRGIGGPGEVVTRRIILPLPQEKQNAEG